MSAAKNLKQSINLNAENIVTGAYCLLIASGTKKKKNKKKNTFNVVHKMPQGINAG